MLPHSAVPTRLGAVFALALVLAASATPAAAQTQRQTCFYADVRTASGPRFISDVFCVYGAVDPQDVMRSFGLWRNGRFSRDQIVAWGETRVTSVTFVSQDRAVRSRNAMIARYSGSLSGTPGWTYYPGAAQLAQGLAELSDAMDRVLVDNGVGASMAMAHGPSNALAFGASVRFGGRWRFHVHNPIEALSLGEVSGPSEGSEFTYRKGWGLELLRNFTPLIAVGVGVHNVALRVETLDTNGDVILLSDKTYWDPTVSFTLPLGHLPLYFRYGQKSQYSVGMIIDFER